jgi:hypothetical protein
MMQNLLRWALAHINFRKIILFAGILLATTAFTQFFTVDVAFMFAGDVMVYCELFAIVSMITLRGHARPLLDAARHKLRQARRRVVIPLHRGFSRQRVTRALRALIPSKTDDDGLIFA